MTIVDSAANGSPAAVSAEDDVEAHAVPAEDDVAASCVETGGVAINDVLRRWTEEGPVVRISTGIASLDGATRGGIAVGDTWILAGAPDAAKTALVVQMGDEWARSGVVVGILAADAASDADSVVLRLAQRRGHKRDTVEDRSTATITALRRELAPLSIVVYGPDTTIEEAAEDLARVVAYHDAQRADERPVRGALIVDSIHAARSSVEERGAGVREAIDTRVRALVRAVRQLRLAGIATAEMARSTYAAPDDARADAAAGAESRALDYVAAAKLVARRDTREDHYALHIARSKSGGVGLTLYLALDRERMLLSEAAPPGPAPNAADRRAEREADADRRGAARAAAIRSAIVTVVRAQPRASGRAIEAAVRRSLGSAGRDAVRRELAGAVAEGALTAERGPRGAELYRLAAPR